jgi:outer membrane protein assembly factor BamB
MRFEIRSVVMIDGFTKPARSRAILVCALTATAALLLSGCNVWWMSNYGPDRRGVNPAERRISTGNVATLQLERTLPDASTPPIVGGGMVFSGSAGFPFRVEAFPATGSSTTPVWTGETIGAVSDLVYSGRVLYAVTFASRLYAFDAAAGTPLWSATNVAGEPVIVNGTLFISAERDGGLQAFDADGTVTDGTTTCSGTPKVCTPVWTAAQAGDVSVANGLVYVAGVSDGFARVAVYDAAGVDRCGGSPRTCEPVFVADTQETDIFLEIAAPMIADGKLYAGVDSGDETGASGQLYVFDAQGAQGCVNRTCEALFTIETDGVQSPPASDAATVYVVDRFFSDPDVIGSDVAAPAATRRNTLRAFDGTTQRWSAPDAVGNVAIGNGVLFVGLTNGHLAAFDAAGAANCSGAPTTCAPLWTSPEGGAMNEPVVVNGRVYVADGDVVRQYGLP